MNVEELEIFGVIGFDGSVRNGLHAHPNGEDLVYPMGKKVTIKRVKTGEQFFLTGHENIISALCISSRGDMIASGQLNHHGFKAKIIIWDYEKREMSASYEMHKVRVDDMCFTAGGEYLISLGGRDDGRIIIWDVRKQSPLSGAFAGSETYGNAVTIARANIHERCFVTAGDGTFKLWRISTKDRRIHGVDVKVGKIKRTITCLIMDEKDEHVYGGTTSGDIIKARLNIEESEQTSRYPTMIGCFSKVPSSRIKNRNGYDGNGIVYAGGVSNLLALREERLIVGAGDGTIELVEIAIGSTAYAARKMKRLPIVPAIITHRTTNVCGIVTSMIRRTNDLILVGTAQCEIHEIELSSFRSRLIVTCHTSAIYDLAFPRTCSDIFVTSGKNDIRVWKLTTQKELLRITVPNFACSSLCFDSNGGSILSAWNDGVIRSFALNGGQLLYEINRAHTRSVSAITITSDDSKLVSGGCDGQVRVWNGKSETRNLLKVLKEHRGPITSLHVSPDDQSLISSSSDGTCILWDFRCLARKFMLRGYTMYMAASFIPNGVQVLTCGKDRKIAYWETLDGSLVREIEGSMTGTLNALSVSHDGRHFLSGADDCIVKLWNYRTASTIRLGLAHAAAITACAFAPNSKFIVTVSADGAIILWKYPSPLEICTAD